MPKSPRELAELAAELLVNGWQQHLEDNTAVYADGRDRLWMSSSESCDRRTVLDALHPPAWVEWTPTRREAVVRGREREEDVVNRLRAIGPRLDPPFVLELVQERVELREPNRKAADGRVLEGFLQASGKIDFRLRWPDLDGGRVSFPSDVKSGQAYGRCSTVDDLLRNPFTRRAVVQVACYCEATGEPVGFVICEQLPGQALPVAPIPIVLEEHRDLVRRFRQLGTITRRAYNAQRRSREPKLPAMTQDQSLCKRCPQYGRNCHPDLGGQASAFLTDPELIADAQLVAQHETIAKQVDKARERVRAATRGTDTVIADDVVIRGSWQRRTTKSLPDTIKQRIDKLRKKHEVTTTNEQGAWRMRVESLDDESEVQS